MKTQGGFHHHKELIALTAGAFFAAAALTGCGTEKVIDPTAGPAPRPEGQTEIAFQQEKHFPVAGYPVLSAPRQEVQTVILQPMQQRIMQPPVQPVPIVHLIAPKEPVLSAETPVVLSSERTEPVTEPVTVSSPLQCDIRDIAAPLRDVVTALEEKSLLYATKPLTDCSGIFHRVVQGLKYRCPGKDFPSVAEHRDSRALARWYHERGNLQLIENAEQSTDLLKPGAVLFFGKNGLVYQDFSVNDLLTPRKGISHIGVVVKVHTDQAGRVLQYDLFHGHGRKGKTAASVTDWHTRTPGKSGYPPFGNGRQQLVAVARL